MAHRQGHLSDETIERIADRVAERLQLAVLAGDDALLTEAEAAASPTRSAQSANTSRLVAVVDRLEAFGSFSTPVRGRVPTGCDLRSDTSLRGAKLEATKQQSPGREWPAASGQNIDGP